MQVLSNLTGQAVIQNSLPLQDIDSGPAKNGNSFNGGEDAFDEGVEASNPDVSVQFQEMDTSPEDKVVLFSQTSNHRCPGASLKACISKPEECAVVKDQEYRACVQSCLERC